MKNSKTIGVFFGSRSPEHDISIITGQLIIAGLVGLGYQVIPVYLSKKGEWLLGKELGKLETFTDPNKKIEPTKFSKYYLDLEKSLGKMVFRKKGLFGKTVIVDIAFPAIHGAYGEDGTIQGLFEMLKVPYVGCDVASSAIAMDKVLTKLLYHEYRIPTTKFIYFTKKDWEERSATLMKEIKIKLAWPVFVKPAHLGSSIAVAKVKDKLSRDLEYRIEVALHYDPKVLVEESVENLIDVTCCVIGDAENPKPSLLQESVFSGDLFDFEEKYLKGGGAQLGKAQNKVIIPARLDEQTTKEIRDLAVKIFKLFGCFGIARVDFLFDKKTKQFFANEINTLPGTLYHHLWKESGMPLEEVLELLIDLAQKRQELKRNIISVFKTDVLKSTSSAKLKL